jgi:uncharacterized membrane protein YdbT with pleckstrin-like domain
MHPEEASGLGQHVLRYLLPSERCVFAVRRHPAILLPSAIPVLGGLVVAFVLDSTLPPDVPYLRDLMWFAWLAAFLWFGWQAFEWWVEKFVVTDRRIILTTGILTRKVGMMPLVKVTDMSYQRSVLGRVLGYGEFIMESAGQDQALHNIAYVPNPDILYLDMCDLLFGPQNVDGG